MSFIVVFVITLLILFASVYVTKRRFGILGLALAAGSVISSMWVTSLTPIIANAGIIIVSPPLKTVVAATLILTPAIILLFRGPTYKSRIHRIIAASAFAVLAVAFLLETMGSALVIDSAGRQVYLFILEKKSLIITFALIFAVADIFMTKTPKHSLNTPKH